GPERSRLERRIADLDAHHWIRLVGRVPFEDLLALYRSSWLITSASLTEGWGLTLTEAAGCGTPAVASDVPGHRSSVLADRTGTLVPVNELGSALADLLIDHERRTMMSDLAVQWARSLSWDRLAEQVLHPLHRRIVATEPKR
ncbi:MAG: glycosyltransferase family 4 protein, partial [Actinomycetota bacterium]